uniref:DNJB1 protein n=1 Tax=Junco hyemalis TaxID=40217 RepID=A0A8C5J1A7_JUNHY
AHVPVPGASARIRFGEVGTHSRAGSGGTRGARTGRGLHAGHPACPAAPGGGREGAGAVPGVPAGAGWACWGPSGTVSGVGATGRTGSAAVPRAPRPALPAALPTAGEGLTGAFLPQTPKNPPGLKGGAPTPGPGGSNGPTFTYTFRGDPHAMFAEFFDGRNPFDTFFVQRNGDDEDGDEGFNTFHVGGFGSVSFPRGRAGEGRKQDPPVLHELRVSLEEIYSGCTKKMKISHKRLGPDGKTVRNEDKILTIEDKPHDVFRRDGSDIVYPARISLREVGGDGPVALGTSGWHWGHRG